MTFDILVHKGVVGFTLKLFGDECIRELSQNDSYQYCIYKNTARVITCLMHEHRTPFKKVIEYMQNYFTQENLITIFHNDNIHKTEALTKSISHLPKKDQETIQKTNTRVQDLETSYITKPDPIDRIGRRRTVTNNILICLSGCSTNFIDDAEFLLSFVGPDIFNDMIHQQGELYLIMDNIKIKKDTYSFFNLINEKLPLNYRQNFHRNVAKNSNELVEMKESYMTLFWTKKSINHNTL